MAYDTFSKLNDSMTRALTKISVKTSSSLEKSKIRMHIESLTRETEKMLMDIGGDVYSLWLQGDFSTQSLVEKLDTVKQKKEAIEQLITELAAIDERDSEILGTAAASGPQEESSASENPCCPSCGFEYDADAKFCRRCGHKLQ